MSLGASRWHVIAESNFPWEREALEWLREQLPDRDPWHVWTNFEFIDDEGRVNELDALVLSSAGLFLVEIKSRPGVVGGDAHTWTWSTDGRVASLDNPLLLTDRKSKRLASLLKRQSAVSKAKIRLPFIEPVIFLSSTNLRCTLEGRARSGVFLRGRPGHTEDDGIVSALTRGVRDTRPPQVDGQQARTISRALAEAGIRPSNKHRQVGDYQLETLLGEGDSYQDWQAAHIGFDNVKRRVRIYAIAKASSAEVRANSVRQAKREFEVLEGIDHPGILRCRDYKDTELGPALIFDHEPRALRLDHFMREHGATLDVGDRLQLVREIAEILQYAHSKQLYHRALAPQSVLVRGVGTRQLAVQLMNWQTAARNAGTAETLFHTTGTLHVDAYVDDPNLVYLAPETTRADPAHGAELDVFSLGCLAYLIFGGQAPASSTLEMLDKLRTGQGLRLSDVMNGCGNRLQDLVQFATSPEVLTRYGSIRDFLKDLEGVEDELTAPDRESTVDPGIARKDDRIEGGFTVIRRMGRGSSSDALLVREDGTDDEFVLKVAIDSAHNESVSAEGDVLLKLRHPNIVECSRKLTVEGRSALLLKSAGDTTLAQKLKQDGRLSLDMLQRFGEELLEAVRHIEENAVTHRDIKPDNIGIAEARSRRLKLVLFDFSLSRTPPENLSAGTPPYLDPFLQQRSHKRWDLYAERFAVAVTLYEMAIGKTPRWGDGLTAPAVLDCEASIESDVFDPAIREPMTHFFAKALSRHIRERHDNAEEMLRAWREIFAQATRAQPAEPQGFAAIAMITTPDTTMAELGYSLEAQDVLERMGIHNTRQLLAVDRIRFRYLRGVGDRIRKEIRLRAKELAQLRPDLLQGRGTLHTLDDSALEDGRTPSSINELAQTLLPRRHAGDERPEDAALEYYLGLEQDGADGHWPTLGDAAQAAGIERSSLTAALLKMRERWLKSPPLTVVRDQVNELLGAQGRVMSTAELAQVLLALRGCAEQNATERVRLATAVVRAAIEAEAQLERPRFEVFEHQPLPLVAHASEWASYARQLGAAADECARADPLLPPARALQALEAVSLPQLAAATEPGARAPELPPSRLLRLATVASQHAALSSRQEIYPRRMPAALALRQSLGAFVGATELSLNELKDRVQGRYPEAEPLPPRPELDRLLQEAGAPLRWDAAAANGAGAYCRESLRGGPTVGSTTGYSRHPTIPIPEQGSDPLIADAQHAESRLQYGIAHGGLMVLGIEPRLARHAERELLHRFAKDAPQGQALRRISLDACLLEAMKAQATALKVDWGVVRRADGTAPGSADWNRLLALVKRAVPAVRQQLQDSPGPLLVLHAGLLARYELMQLVADAEATVGRPGHTPALWLLLPMHQQGLPTIDGVPVPLVNASQAIRLPRAWVENVHRARGTP